LRKTPIPQLPSFDDDAASVLDAIDWIFKMAFFFSQMNIFYSEMITLPLPISTNKVIIPHRFSIMLTNQLVQEIEAILLPQTPEAIARRQS